MNDKLKPSDVTLVGLYAFMALGLIAMFALLAVTCVTGHVPGAP